MKYACIVADPPWLYRVSGGRAAATEHYETTGTPEICAIQPPAADQAHLYLWVTNTHLLDGDGCQVVRAWGFEPKSLVTWVKRQKRGIGMGHYFRNTTEHVIFATRGKLPVQRNNMPTHFTGDERGHSVKPDGLLWIAEQMSPGPRLEMFARTRRDGWDVWGNESPDAAQMVVGL